MESNTKIIVWNKVALLQFQKAISFIKEKSPQNAEKVKNVLIALIERLSIHPENFPPDKYKQNNDGNYRAFEKYHFRISYYVTAHEIRILRIRHTKRKPLNY
ncbi:MAG: type II toxin-antitoxin system RelE/ParE family toxin [Chitinophaga sp.]|jgi:plasmid stabilization system protein ParE|nr:type II toxin-antitoxin system RelE/ParE family toxin [Chitinophaga sp.]